MTRSSHGGHHRAPNGAHPGAAHPRGGPAQPGAGYRGPVAARAAGITYRQLDYWARAGLVEPSVRAHRPESGARLYHAGDVLVLTVVRRLLEAGVSLQQVRTTTTSLREHCSTTGTGTGADHGSDLDALTLMCDGATVYPCTSADEVIELVQGGQGVFGIAVGPVWAAVVATLATLPAEGDPEGGDHREADELAARRAAREAG